MRKFEQPTIEDERKLNDVVEDKKEIVYLRGSKWKIGYLKNGTRRKVSNVYLDKDEKEEKVICKCASLLLLNSYFKIVFFHWFLWRWFYYVKEYTDGELMSVIDACKKKVDVESYFVDIIYLTEIKDTIMMMTREEVSRIRQENFGAQHGLLERNMDASMNP